MGTNYWISSEENIYGQWIASLPDGKTLEPEQALAFFSSVLEAGERERVFRVKQTIQPFPYSELMNHSYAQHLKYIWEEQEELMFFNHLSHAYPVSALRGGKTLAPTLTPATLCYYDVDGNITEGEVTDMGELLEQLRESEIDLYQDGDETYPHPPITISGGLPNVPCHQEDSFYIIITLHTDIWLPRVRGDLERSIQRRKNPKPPIDLSNIAEAIKIDYGKLFEQINRGEYVPNLNPDYDNLELAMCHTPRFNRFLAEVKQLTLDLGGEFSSERGNINGIILP